MLTTQVVKCKLLMAHTLSYEIAEHYHDLLHVLQQGCLLRLLQAFDSGLVRDSVVCILAAAKQKVLMTMQL